ncbi:MAG: endonuclease III [Nanoarchaeota archaeon]
MSYHLRVLQIIQKAVQQFEEPSVTQISKVTKHDPYRVLISCLLSLRTKDATTTQASIRLFFLADTPHKMITLTPQRIERAIYPVGFYHVKTRTILDISKTLLKDYHGEVPKTMEELLTLKGVGRKTANIVLTYGHQNPEGLAVDTHVHRLSNRLGLVKTKIPEQTEHALRALFPKKHWMIINDTFVTFGQNICTPISPHCSICPAKKDCPRVGVTTSR